MASFTGTTHATWIPEQWADEFRVGVEANLVMAKLIKMVEHDKKVKGDIVHIPDVSNYTAVDLVMDDNDKAGVAVAESEFTITLDKSKAIILYFPYHLADQLSKYAFRAPYTAKIQYGLAKVIDDDIFALFSGLSQAVGTTADGLAGNISDPLILAAIEKLDEAEVPDDGERSLVLRSRQKSKALAIDKYVRADAIGEKNERITQARFVDLYGMPTYFTSQTPVKLAATAPATPTDSHAGLMFHREALALAKPMDVNIQYEKIPEKFAYLLSGDILYGVAEYRDPFAVVVFTKNAG